MNSKEKSEILEIVCPTTLFPYAREHIDSLLTRANFPPLMLAPINFEALYRKHQQQRAAQQQGAEADMKPKDKKELN